MNEIEGGVTAPLGFHAAGVAAGVKPKGLDVAIIASETPATVAAVFTKSAVKAAPVVVSQGIVAAALPIRAIVVNSGNANACTGSSGLRHASQMCETVAEQLGCGHEQVIVASTGVIGVPLPIEPVRSGIRAACAALQPGPQAAAKAAEAILTTDTTSKQIAVTLEIDQKQVTIGGMAKGSGMIHPNMATMLGFVTTDADVEPATLQALLREAVDKSYNMISVDGDTSTNDMVVTLANGRSGAKITPGNDGFSSFQAAFQFVQMALAKQIVRDGEGATKFIEVTVRQAKSLADARKLVKTVITSSLVKTAFFGEDANWGRILAAMGRSGANFDPSRVSISFASEAGALDLMADGEPVPFDEAHAKLVLQPRELQVDIVLRDGEDSATGWGCDLSYEYVRINGDYRT